MAKLTRRAQMIAERVEAGKIYTVTTAVELLTDLSTVKFSESIDVSINLGVDPRKSDQVVRGSTVLPNGTGKNVKVAVFTQGDNVSRAKDAGADLVGLDDLAEQIKAGNLNFDVVIATPDAMRVVGQLGQILGPRGLMPNPKVGTVTPDVESAVKNAKAGQVRYRTDKNGIIHCTLGQIGFSPAAVEENLVALLTDIKKMKPSSSKWIYMKKVNISTTMGPGLSVDYGVLKI
jgi:large subunit ribosomal protein L1